MGVTNDHAFPSTAEARVTGKAAPNLTQPVGFEVSDRKSFEVIPDCPDAEMIRVGNKRAKDYLKTQCAHQHSEDARTAALPCGDAKRRSRNIRFTYLQSNHALKSCEFNCSSCRIEWRSKSSRISARRRTLAQLDDQLNHFTIRRVMQNR